MGEGRWRRPGGGGAAAAWRRETEGRKAASAGRGRVGGRGGGRVVMGRVKRDRGSFAKLRGRWVLFSISSRGFFAKLQPMAGVGRLPWTRVKLASPGEGEGRLSMPHSI